MLMEKLRQAGWSTTQPAIAYLESGKRTLLDYELQFLLNIFGKSWKDIALDAREPKNFPKPRGERRHHLGTLVRYFRTEAGLSQEKLAVKLQLAGWDVDRLLVLRIESGQRPLYDRELQFILDVLKVDWESIFGKYDVSKRTPCKKKNQY